MKMLEVDNSRHDGDAKSDIACSSFVGLLGSFVSLLGTIQRILHILEGKTSLFEIISHMFVGKKCLRSNHLFEHFSRNGYQLDWGDTKWMKDHLERGRSPCVVLMGQQEQWMVAIGIENDEVYWIEDGGIFKAPLQEFRSNAAGIQLFAFNFWDCLRVYL